MLRVSEYLSGRAILDQPPGIHDAEPVGDRGMDGHVMGDKHHRRLQPLLHLLDQRQHILLHQHVERSGRLVRDDELRLTNRRQRNRQPLAHPAGQLVRKRFQHAGIELQPL